MPASSAHPSSHCSTWRRPLRSRHAAALVAMAFAVAGCGTTVDGVGTTTAAGAPQGGLSVPGAASSGAAAAGTGGSAAAGAGAFAGTTGSAGSVPAGSAAGAVGDSSAGAAGGAIGARGAALPTSGRGYDAGHVYLGFPTNNDVNKAAGLGTNDFGDQEAQIKAVVGDVNKHGGLLGRTVVPVFHDIKTSDLEVDPQTQAQATCTAFTQDRTVLAVINIVANIDLPTFFACLAKHDTPEFSAGFVPVDDTLLRQYSPYLYKLTAAAFDGLTPLWISRLLALGYFRGWNTTTGKTSPAEAKIGLLYPDAQPQIRIFAGIKSELASHGLKVTKEYRYDVSSLNAESSAMANAVLAFRNAGVTHILSSESDVFLFMEAADSQHYRPRY